MVTDHGEQRPIEPKDICILLRSPKSHGEIFLQALTQESIPVISDSVSIESNNTLKIALGETYMLPVKGAKYKITIPAGAVADEVHRAEGIYDRSRNKRPASLFKKLAGKKNV